MMKKETQQRFENLKKLFGDRLFTEKELFNEVPADSYVSMSTLRRYDLVECVEVEIRKEYSVDDLIAEINEMIGEDCYCGTGQFQKEGDKIFFVDYYYRYKLR